MINTKHFVALLCITLLTSLPGSGVANISPPQEDTDHPTLRAVIEYSHDRPVTEPEITEVNFDDFIDIKVEKIKLDSSYLSGKFHAYHVNITNNTPYNLEIVQANIVNGYDGESAYNLVRRRPLSLPSLRLSISYTVLARSAFKSAQALVRNKTAKGESLEFSNNIPKELFEEGESLAFNALVPAGEKPKLFIKYYHPEEKKVYYSYRF